ncbi:Six-bladed beta-propeller [Parasponia andersonii]|uniref:Six-bladed beta-propeller n=1 Tax=Parasponia andersonii TaxID=3476 RepID=A0A2P5DZQ7_PARAD|nr:Six-bladed beta-propeller [Parasponia andersonii]
MSLLRTPPVFSFSFAVVTLLVLSILLGQASTRIQARKPHAIYFRYPNLYQEGITWDPSAQHFIVGSLRARTLFSVSDAGVAETLIFDPDLPENVTIGGLAIDTVSPLPLFDGLVAYDLRTQWRVFLSLLPSSSGGSEARPMANDVAVDFKGNAYVTNSMGTTSGRSTTEERPRFSPSRRLSRPTPSTGACPTASAA